jgi:hypothetical protein
MHPLALATSNGFLGHTDTMLGLNDILLDEEMEEEEGMFVSLSESVFYAQCVGSLGKVNFFT